MDIGIHKSSPSDDIGQEVKILTTDGEASGRLQLYYPQTGAFLLTACFLDGDFVGELMIPDRDIIPDDGTEAKYIVVSAAGAQQQQQQEDKKKTKQKNLPACLKGLMGMESLSIKDTAAESCDKEEEENVRTSCSPAWDEFADTMVKEVEQELDKSKNARMTDSDKKEDDEVDEDNDPVMPDDVIHWSDAEDLPFDAEVIVLRNTTDPCFNEAMDTILDNDRIGVAVFGKEINRFHSIDYVCTSCGMPVENDVEPVIFVFILKHADGRINEDMLMKMTEILQSDPTLIKVVHDCSPLSDMLMGRLNISWSSCEVQDSMCYDVELCAEDREYWMWKEGKRRSKPTACVRIEDLLLRYLHLDVGADAFPHYGQDDEYRCVLHHPLTIEAENFVKRKTLFLPYLVDAIVDKAEAAGYTLKELDELTQTRLELRRESEDGQICQYEVDERYYVRMSGMYVNPHSIARRDREAIEEIRKPMTIPVRDKVWTKADLKWIPHERMPKLAAWIPKDSLSSGSSDSADNSSGGGSGNGAEQGDLYWWQQPNEREREEEERSRRYDLNNTNKRISLPAPAGHCHNLNQKRGPQFMGNVRRQ